MNKPSFHDHKNLDALINAAKAHPNELIRDQLIDLEIDLNGNFVGFDAANWIWHKAIPDAA